MDSDEQASKFLLFDPDIVNIEDHETKNKILEQVTQVVG